MGFVLHVLALHQAVAFPLSGAFFFKQNPELCSWILCRYLFPCPALCCCLSKSSAFRGGFWKQAGKVVFYYRLLQHFKALTGWILWSALLIGGRSSAASEGTYGHLFGFSFLLFSFFFLVCMKREENWAVLELPCMRAHAQCTCMHAALMHMHTDACMEQQPFLQFSCKPEASSSRGFAAPDLPLWLNEAFLVCQTTRAKCLLSPGLAAVHRAGNCKMHSRHGSETEFGSGAGADPCSA